MKVRTKIYILCVVIIILLGLVLYFVGGPQSYYNMQRSRLSQNIHMGQ